MSAKTSRGLGGGPFLSLFSLSPSARDSSNRSSSSSSLLLLAVSLLGWAGYNIDGSHAETLHSFYTPHGSIYAVFWGLQCTPRNIGGRFSTFRRCFFPFFSWFWLYGPENNLDRKTNHYNQDNTRWASPRWRNWGSCDWYGNMNHSSGPHNYDENNPLCCSHGRSDGNNTCC